MVSVDELPEIKPDQEDFTQIDVRLKVIELHRDEWQLTGGYSGYQGAFLGGSFSTVNFLGAGEKMELVLEYGERSKNYIAGFSEPYLFDNLLSFRFSLFNRDIVYPDLFERRGKGIQLGFDAKFKDYWWTGISYKFEEVEVDPSGFEKDGSLASQNLSSFTAFLSKDTVDNPFFPTEGMRCFLSCSLAGSSPSSC